MSTQKKLTNSLQRIHTLMPEKLFRYNWHLLALWLYEQYHECETVQAHFRYFEFQATLSSLTKAIASGGNKENSLSGKGYHIIPYVDIVQEGSQVSQAKEIKATLKIDVQPTGGSECFSQEKNGKEQQHSETPLHSPSWLFFCYNLCIGYQYALLWLSKTTCIHVDRNLN
jgi:hypothetical protein